MSLLKLLLPMRVLFPACILHLLVWALNLPSSFRANPTAPCGTNSEHPGYCSSVHGLLHLAKGSIPVAEQCCGASSMGNDTTVSHVYQFGILRTSLCLGITSIKIMSTVWQLSLCACLNKALSPGTQFHELGSFVYLSMSNLLRWSISIETGVLDMDWILMDALMSYIPQVENDES